MTTMAWDEMNETQRALQLRNWRAKALGGFRALDAFTPEKFVASEANAAAFAVAKAFDNNKENLYLFGPTGTGKSHLATIAARRHLSDKGAGVVTVTQMQIARSIRAAEKASKESETIEKLSLAPVLVVSDLGVGKDTEFSLSVLYEIIDGRYMNRPGGLIVSSNLSIDEIATKTGDDRISSRLAQMCKDRIFNVGGADWRAK